MNGPNDSSENGPPPLTKLPAAMSFTAWVGALSFWLPRLRARLSGLGLSVALLFFLSVLFALVGLEIPT